MNIEIIDCQAPTSMEPLTCQRGYSDLPVAGVSLKEAIIDKIEKCAAEVSDANDVSIQINAWLSDTLIKKLLTENVCITDKNGETLAFSNQQDNCQKVDLDDESIVIQYPWDVLAVNEQLVKQLDQDVIEGKVSDGVHIEGHIKLGEGSVLLPGVFIEGNVIIGKNCKVGPNCYIRGNSVVMDNCHVGQAVEIKNSILMNNVAAGHLTYLGDSIICPYVNFGAGTITANFRHDGKNHRSMADGVLLDTGRRKLGAIIGDHVHTGIHTSVYPGRKIWPDMMTLPGDVVQKDLKN